MGGWGGSVPCILVAAPERGRVHRPPGSLSPAPSSGTGGGEAHGGLLKVPP